MPEPSPFTMPEVFGRFIVGGVYIPGHVFDVDGCHKPERWVFQMGLTVSNSVSIWRGTKLAESIRIKTQITSDDEYQDAVRYRKTIRPKIGAKPPVLQIVNGIFAFAGITRISVVDIILEKYRPGNSWELESQFCEYNPMKMVPVGPADAPKAESELDRAEKAFSEAVRQAVAL